MDISRIPPAWQEWWEERAAIVEYEGRMAREAAEAEATVALREYLARLARERKKR